MSVLDDPFVREQLREAWRESEPGTNAPHEEGGFVLRHEDGSLSIERWPRGAKNRIVVPAHPHGMRGNLRIVATFHTHPNPGVEFQQEPSITDIRAVRDDPHLNDLDFEGEFVIATEHTYVVRKTGRVEIVDETSTVLRLT